MQLTHVYGTTSRKFPVLELLRRNLTMISAQHFFVYAVFLECFCCEVGHTDTGIQKVQMKELTK